MTIEDLKKLPRDGKKHFRLKSPSGTEFIGCLDEIQNPKSPVNWQLCSVNSEPLTLMQAMEWSQAHQLSTEQINQIESELMARAPATQ